MGVIAWLLAPPLAAAAAARRAPFWRAQQLVGTVHMASQVLVLGGILLVDWPWRARVWHLPGIHIQMGAPYEDIR